MTAAEFGRYIKDPSSMGPEAVSELSAVVEQFPFFQPAHILLTLAAKKYDAAVYQKTLKKTAIVVCSRGRLFELLDDQEKQAGIFAAKRSEETRIADVAAAPDLQNDLVLLKAAEQKAEEPARPEAAADAALAEKQLEAEIGRQVVQSFIEKEVLKTPDLHREPAVQSNKPVSFGDWLSYLKKNNGQPYADIEQEVKKEKIRQQETSRNAPAERRQKNKAIIDNIIEKNPGHIRVKEEPRFFDPESRAKDSLLENEHLVTETLAKIYALQGNTAKAIRAYQILGLKNPRKSAYFAALIQELKNQNKSE